MKKIFVTLLLIISTFLGSTAVKGTKMIASAEERPKGKLAIVIDDFGEDRRGVEEMLSIKAPLTIAVMPAGEFTKEDAEKAHQNGHEVILHMPMENETPMPASYYGPVLIKNEFSETQAVETLSECINAIPHCAGVNIHMGTGVSKNKSLITAMMQEVKKRDLYFLDSKTIENSVCPECAKATGVKFYSRDVFLEPSGRPSEEVSTKYLLEAGELALKNGEAVAIGHVGPVGEEKTAKTLENCLQRLSEMGVEIVHLSKL